MSKFEKKTWGYEYVSDNGLVYGVGEVTAEYNVVVDYFEDIIKLFDGNVLIKDCLVDYIYGDLICGEGSDAQKIKDWLDNRISRYENHERTVRFYRDVIGRENTLYTCYLGFAEKKDEQSTMIPAATLLKMAREDSV